jgi:hypothetical protein
MIECNLCRMQFDADDDDLENRKQIHENFHKPRLVKSNKIAGLKTNVNTTVGKVVWKILCKHGTSDDVECTRCLNQKDC